MATVVAVPSEPMAAASSATAADGATGTGHGDVAPLALTRHREVDGGDDHDPLGLQQPARDPTQRVLDGVAAERLAPPQPGHLVVDVGGDAVPEVAELVLDLGRQVVVAQPTGRGLVERDPLGHRRREVGQLEVPGTLVVGPAEIARRHVPTLGRRPDRPASPPTGQYGVTSVTSFGREAGAWGGVP